MSVGAFGQSGDDSDMIHVIAINTAKPGQPAAVLDAFHANVPTGVTAHKQATVDAFPAPQVQAPFRITTSMVVGR